MDGETVNQTTWFLETNGSLRGPYKYAELVRLIYLGDLRLEHQSTLRIYCPLSKTWSTLGEKFGHIHPTRNWQPPAPPSHVQGSTFSKNFNLQEAGIDYFGLLSEHRKNPAALSATPAAQVQAPVSALPAGPSFWVRLKKPVFIAAALGLLFAGTYYFFSTQASLKRDLASKEKPKPPTPVVTPVTVEKTKPAQDSLGMGQNLVKRRAVTPLPLDPLEKKPAAAKPDEKTATATQDAAVAAPVTPLVTAPLTEANPDQAANNGHETGREPPQFFSSTDDQPVRTPTSNPEQTTPEEKQPDQDPQELQPEEQSAITPY